MPIVTPGRTPAHVQELQVIACHLLCEMVEDALFGAESDGLEPALPRPLEARTREGARA